MKCFFVKDGSIGNITLNEACSAGCGSFIQNFAEGLHMTPAEFAAKAIDSKAPVDLGTRCTVFMNSKVKQAQKEGADVADISAGIAFSVIKNALFKVMQLKDVREFGDHIVVQGGTFYNDAVLRCMEKLLDRDVIRPDIAGLMGAYGAAILAMEAAEEAGMQQSSLLSPDELDHFSVATSSYRCRGCGNKCLITMQKFPDGGKYFTGNRCERGIGGQKKDSDTPNIYQYKYERLFKYYEPLEQPVRGTIGLPRPTPLGAVPRAHRAQPDHAGADPQRADVHGPTRVTGVVAQQVHAHRNPQPRCARKATSTSSPVRICSAPVGTTTRQFASASVASRCDEAPGAPPSACTRYSPVSWSRIS